MRAFHSEDYPELGVNQNWKAVFFSSQKCITSIDKKNEVEKSPEPQLLAVSIPEQYLLSLI